LYAALIQGTTKQDYDLIKAAASKGHFKSIVDVIFLNPPANYKRLLVLFTAMFEGMLGHMTIITSYNTAQSLFKRSTNNQYPKKNKKMLIEALASAIMLVGFHHKLNKCKLKKRLDKIMPTKGFRLSSVSSWNYLQSKNIYPGSNLAILETYDGTAIEVIKNLHASCASIPIQYKRVILMERAINLVIESRDIESFNWLYDKGLVDSYHVESMTMNDMFMARVHNLISPR
jgi:hypothetical protein